MDARTWQSAKELLADVAHLPTAEQRAYVEQHCADPTLRRELLAMLDSPAPLSDVIAGATTLAPGSRLGPFEIVAPIGAGGMGEVYRAHDTQLGRDVAVKVLPRSLCADPDRLARLEREARLLATLNHPHIGAIYGVEDGDGVRALILELIEGESLAARIARGPLACADALRFSGELAEALAAAHEKGIVHRDLKPANIHLTNTGSVKVIDFGIAKASGQDLLGTGPATREGTVLGTAGYMSPEQTRGEAADCQTDVWAFGCVLFEMLSGRRAFAGETTSDVVAGVLEREPRWSALPASTPEIVRSLLRRCLHKDRARRLRGMAHVRLELDDALHHAAPRAAHSWVPWALAVMGLFVVIAGIVSLWKSPPPARTIRSTLSLPEGLRFVTGSSGGEGWAVVSPDGQHLAVVAAGEDGVSRISVRPLDRLESRFIPGTEGAFAPFWSPDSRSIGFFAEEQLKTTPLSGGPVALVCPASNARGGSWGPNGVILFSPSFRTAIYRVPATGGTPEPATTLAAPDSSHRWPFFLPDGRHFLYLSVLHAVAPGEQDAIIYASLDGKEKRPLVASFTNAAYASGSLLYLRENALLAQPFAPDTGVLNGAPVPVGDAVQTEPAFWRALFSASQSGQIVYAAHRRVESQLTWVDRDGKRIALLGSKIEALAGTALSHAADRIALVINRNGTTDIWIHDVATGVQTPLVSGRGSSFSPVWSADDRWIGYISTRDTRATLHRIRADGSEPEEQLWEGPSASGNEVSDWSNDGRFILLSTGAIGSQALSMLQLGTEGKPAPVVPFERSWTNDGHFSPDGKWVVYETGKWNIGVAGLGGRAGHWQVSSVHGTSPRWRGNEILYLSLDGFIMSAAVKRVGDGLRIDQPHRLCPIVGIPRMPFVHFVGSFDATTRADRFLVDTIARNSDKPLTLVTNWTADLKR